MAGGRPGRHRAGFVFWGWLAAVGACGLLAPNASAVEFFDGRVQVHGFGEVQVRTINKSYGEQWDLTQWYNILNMELEFDIAPDGFGPVDLLEAYVRAEARFDCTWYRACWLAPPANTFGNRAERLPDRLSNATDQDYGGTLGPLEPAVLRHYANQPSGLVSYFQGDDPANKQPQGVITQIRRRVGFPGLDTLFDSPGADTVLAVDPRTNIDDDPARYAFRAALGYRWAFVGTAGGTAAATQILGPWLPENEIQTNGLFANRANPFRGRVTPQVVQGVRAHEFEDIATLRAFFPSDPSGVFSATTPVTVDPLDKRIRDLLIYPDGSQNVDTALNGDLVPSKVPFAYPRQLVDAAGDPKPTLGVPNINGGIATNTAFGGDYSGVIPCREPVKPPQARGPNMDEFPLPTDSFYASNTQQQIRGSTSFGGCVPDGRPDTREWLGSLRNPRFNNAGVNNPANPNSVTDPNFPPYDPTKPTTALGDSNLWGLGTNIGIVGGAGENPLRPAPDVSNLSRFNPLVAQGLYYPSQGLKKALLSGTLDEDLGFNFSQLERAFNRGQSQQQTGELKEAYFDIEWLDSRLWTRIGLQNIVWGKTELFRTTDQFNPQDLALSSLPSLEESRIALWALRAVYSLYDVGPLNDVRLEFAMNFDEYQPADLGACGEPYTLDVVCNLTTGIFAHSALGIGIAGIDRPPAAWDDIKGAEIGGRVEWRWDRFSFAVTDFWGYDDFPYVDRISNYSRNVDPTTGRPLVVGARGDCTGFAGPTWNQAALRVTSYASMTISGVGRDPDCLKPGGAAGKVGALNPNANGLTPLVRDPDTGAIISGGNFGGAPGLDSPQNALEFHSANLTAFATICAGTVGIAAALDATACGFNIWGSFHNLIADDTTTPVFSDVLATNFAGEPSGEAIGFLRLIMNQQTGRFTPTVPTTALNRERAFNCLNAPILEDRPCEANPHSPTAGVNVKWYGDGRITSLNSAINLDLFNGLLRSDQIPQNPNNWLTLDSTMTAEQRALLGCGPFFGTRCDSSSQGRQLQLVGGNPQVFGRGAGAFDPLNTEASALLQSFPGFEGTGRPGMNNYGGGAWTTTSSRLIQPGTVQFRGGPICTRLVGGKVVTLPGCRGADAFTIVGNELHVRFEKGYDPAVDGCVFQPVIGQGTATPKKVVAVGKSGTPNGTLNERLKLCEASTSKVGSQTAPSMFTPMARTLYHPLAGCLDMKEAQTGIKDLSTYEGIGGIPCDFLSRDFDAEFLAGSAQVFRNEMAAFSYNFMIFLVISSCDDGRRTVRARPPPLPAFAQDPECFNATQTELDPTTAEIGPDGNFIRATNDAGLPVIDNAWRSDVCGFNAPQFCTNVKGFLNASGTGSPRTVAAGNERFGRRNFIWHSGGEVVLRYDKRNVFGFSMDFAEDVTKTNWGVEATWLNHVPFIDNSSFSNVRYSDVYNLTVSVDRPTFVNFLNANRTFFMNTQWFFQYVSNYNDNFPGNGPWNVLFTFAVFTGYFQDRLLPTLVTVYDFRSQSGGVLPNIVYRFNEAFSVTVGMLWFFGRWETVNMPVNEIGTNVPRVGASANRDGVHNLLSNFRWRDEIFFTLRYTF